jgi:hypothetical protein
MKVDPVELSRLRARAVNTRAFFALSLPERKRVRKALAAEPQDWTAEAIRYIEAGKRLR